MSNLIDKSALVAEINQRIEDYKSHKIVDSYHDGLIFALEDLRDDFIDTLEVKEWDNVWHDAGETPKGAGDKEILVQFADSHASVLEIDDWEYLDHQTKWAYLKDLI